MTALAPPVISHLQSYEHSGKLPMPAMMMMLIGGTLAAVICGAAYGAIIWYLPFVYISVALTFGIGFLAGYMMGHIGKKFHCRNNAAMIIMGLVAGFAAWYGAWVGWTAAASEGQIITFSPLAQAAVMLGVMQEGIWNVFDWTPTGVWLAGIWALEFLIIMGMSFVFAKAAIEGKIYCESCQQWLKTDCSSPALTRMEQPSELNHQLLSGQYHSLLSPHPEKHDASQYMSAELTTCPACQQVCYLTVNHIDVTVDKEGKVHANNSNLLQNVIIPPETFVDLKANWEIMFEQREEEQPMTDDTTQQS